jgi:choline dehydrogenase-like flavoprotein
VLAARLSENPSTSVLLLEAGNDYRADEAPAEMRSPNFIEIVRRGGFHWPELMARLTKSQPPTLYLQGRGLGGSSAINATGAVRGMPADYDDWSKQGCTRWGWREVLTAFIRLEDDRDFGERPITAKTAQSRLNAARPISGARLQPHSPKRPARSVTHGAKTATRRKEAVYLPRPEIFAAACGCPRMMRISSRPEDAGISRSSAMRWSSE